MIEDHELIITTADLRTCRFCADGTYRVFMDRGLNWRKFIRRGLPLSEFGEQDHLVISLKEAALKRLKEGFDDGRRKKRK